MSIVIKTEKIVLSSGALGRKIIGFSALTRKELPEEYNSGKPFVFLSADKELLSTLDNGAPFSCIRVGITCTQLDFDRVLEYVRASGKRLARIKAEHKRKQAEWNGLETFVI